MQRYRLLAIGSIVSSPRPDHESGGQSLVPSRWCFARVCSANTRRPLLFLNLGLTFGSPATGAAWGIFGNLPDGWRVPFFVVIGVVAIAVIIGIYRSSDGQNLVRWALTLVLGGAIGNLIDRVRLGFVVDFIDWHYKTHHWPTFNIADVAISVGVGLLILDMIVNRDRDSDEATTSS